MTTRNRIWTQKDSLPPKFPLSAFADRLELSPLVAAMLVSRGFADLAKARGFLDPSDYSPFPSAEIPDLATAADLIRHALESRTPILVWGDFDVDGQTASALLVEALQRLDGQVCLHIPDRERESHGITVARLRDVIVECRPGLLLTCDTGVAAFEAIDYAKNHRLSVVITDHHDLPPHLPRNADAIWNPKRLPDGHPVAQLPGVGVAYKLVEYLFSHYHRKSELSQFLDLVALGIVADVVPLVDDTRYLLQRGLEELRNTQRLGLQTLLKVAGLDPGHLDANDIGFQIAPRLNASGRLDNAMKAVELLTTDDPTQARVLAHQLESLNNQRRLLTHQVLAAAREQIARDPSLADWEALVLSHPTWHPGIIGIVANHLAQEFQKPVVLLNTVDPNRARGSARSVPGCDIGAAIAAQSDLLLQHGGHPGAAGLSLPPDNIPAFRRRLSETVRAMRPHAKPPDLLIDAWLELDALSLELVHELNRLAPFGPGNPPITFATGNLKLRNAEIIGRTREHRRLIVEDATGIRRDVVWWDGAARALPEGVFDLAYHLGINRFDPSEIQITLVDFRQTVTETIEVQPKELDVVDHRGSPYPTEVLSRLKKAEPEALIWAEGYRRVDSPGIPLHELIETPTLIVFTTPYAPQAVQKALEQTKPGRVMLLAVDPPQQALSEVLARLAELVGFVLTKLDGHTRIHDLSAAVAQAPETIRLVLDYFAAHEGLAIQYRRGGVVQISREPHPPRDDAAPLRAALEAAISETAAYRAFFRRAEVRNLLPKDAVS